ncbi:MAG: methyltransferase domain-containing protein [Chloroflexi bacterium]|nr:methyltransferase domain-containing protein [Ardenticatenaceae bacterium]MBL1131377.1 methyltransferase domain-containing protein [Chloroflexota bacterium]NOG37481.1 methyltransferase domain-containing protein [Chloroflexota bacterium]
MDANYQLPNAALLKEQAEWLAPARARLLRGVGIAHRRRVLDLGAGYGAVTGELVRRGGGTVVALDQVITAVTQIPNVPGVCGDAQVLPFVNESFDLVFCQCVLLWVGGGVEGAIAEIHRTLQPGGVLVALEPDYGGLIEHPPEIVTRDLWLAALRRAGAEPHIGRMLPGLLERQGFQVQTRLLDELVPASPTRFEFLRTLPLTEAETAVLYRMVQLPTPPQVVHLPFMLVTAVK